MIKPSLVLHCVFVVEGKYRGMRTTNDLEAMKPPSGKDQVIGGTAAEGSVDRERRTVWTMLSGALGGIVGLAPHVLHHIGPLVGTALVAGSGGTVLFAVLGLVAAVPMLIKLRHRFSNWWAPGIALGVFTAMFLISSFVVGPLISALNDPVAPGLSEVNHLAHHS